MLRIRADVNLIKLAPRTPPAERRQAQQMNLSSRIPWFAEAGSGCQSELADDFPERQGRALKGVSS